ncbi:Hpt domain-containing protein, partial [Acinetobacter baumannii]
RLKGTAGSLGFAHVGKIAGTVESGLLNCTTDDTSVLRHKLKTLEEQVSQCFEIAQSDAERLSKEEGLPTNHFGRKVALIGAYDS